MRLVIIWFIGFTIGSFFQAIECKKWENGYCVGKSQGEFEGRHPSVENDQCGYEIGIEWPDSYKFIKNIK